jgi:DNA-binding cell septation regulator SpoVG
MPIISHHPAPEQDPHGSKPLPLIDGRVINVTLMEKGNLRAFVDVEILRAITIRSFRVVQEPLKRAWVSVPQREYTDAAGQRTFAPVVELRPDLKMRLFKAILIAWQKAIAKGGAA